MESELLQLGERVVTTLGGAIVLRPVLEKLLGPTFDYAGKSLAGLLERYGNMNLGQIFRRAADKVGGAESNSRKFVNPRVLKTLIVEGSFADDLVAQEYFAGLLASSISDDGKDDRAVTFLAIIASLTTRQVRLHHLMYSYVRVLYAGQPVSFYSTLPTIFLPDTLLDEHGVSNDDATKAHTISGLSRDNLIDVRYSLQRYAILLGTFNRTVGSVLKGSALGSQLFLWVHGQPNVSADALFDRGLHLTGWQPPSTLPVLDDAALRHQADAISALAQAIEPGRTFDEQSGLLGDFLHRVTYASAYLPPRVNELIAEIPIDLVLELPAPTAELLAKLREAHDLLAG